MGLEKKGNRVRKSYAEYGLTREMAKKIIGYCRGMPDVRLVEEAARKANPFITGQIVRSLIGGKSYDQLKKESHIIYGKTDFYAYRRKAVYELKKCKERELPTSAAGSPSNHKTTEMRIQGNYNTALAFPQGQEGKMKHHDKHTNELVIRLVERFKAHAAYVGHESPVVAEAARMMCSNDITWMWALTQM